MSLDSSSYTPAERKLVNAARAGELCDLTGEPDRGCQVRGTVIVELLAEGLPVHLVGADIDELVLADQVTSPLLLRSCGIAECSFRNATFTRANFTGATFTQNANFEGAAALVFRFDGATFTGAAAGPFVAATAIIFDGVTMTARMSIDIATPTISLQRLTAREGVTLTAYRGIVDLTDAEFLRQSIIEGSSDIHTILRDAEPIRPEHRKNAEAYTELTRWMIEQPFQPAELLTVRRAVLSDVALAGLSLRRCSFAGAHGLDKVRIDARCTFQRTRRPCTRRLILAEEVQWRHQQPPRRRGRAATRWNALRPPVSNSDAVPDAAVIAGIYRDLRKGLEDGKDEPGAADFYYGEMEMRRTCGRTGPEDRRTPLSERRLLDLYWALSGYGLRASRALTALLVLLAACTALFTVPAFGHTPAPTPRASSVNTTTGAITYNPHRVFHPDTSPAGRSRRNSPPEKVSPSPASPAPPP